MTKRTPTPLSHVVTFDGLELEELPTGGAAARVTLHIDGARVVQSVLLAPHVYQDLWFTLVRARYGKQTQQQIRRRVADGNF